MSETLSGVTQLKIRDICLFVDERAERASETVLGVDNAKSGICYPTTCKINSKLRVGPESQKVRFFSIIFSFS